RTGEPARAPFLAMKRLGLDIAGSRPLLPRNGQRFPHDREIERARFYPGGQGLDRQRLPAIVEVDQRIALGSSVGEKGRSGKRLHAPAEILKDLFDLPP